MSKGKESLSDILSRYVVTTGYADIPDQTVLAEKRILFDTLSVAMAGRDEAGVCEARQIFEQQGGVAESSLWGSETRLPSMNAAFINGVAAAALDFDSLHEAGTMHANIAVAPAVLALAEARGASGRDVLAALAIGDDIACRLGMSTRGHAGWFYSSLHGTFGATAAAAKILGLDETATRNALGIALSQTGGTQQPAQEKVLTKRMQTAFSARAGMFAALLAEKGVTGPTAAFDGAFGFYSMYEKGDIDTVLDGLGDRFEGANMSFKAFPSCACNHALICAVLEIVQEHDLEAEQVDAVEATITPYMKRLVGAPFSLGENPQVAAQFSAQYSIAAVLLHRRLTLAEIQEAVVLDSRIGKLTKRISLVVDDRETGEFGPATVSISCADGRTLKSTINDIPGRPDNPISDVELLRKADTCLPGASGASLFDCLMALESCDTMEPVLDVLRTGTNQ